jgi:hypothetical protein
LPEKKTTYPVNPIQNILMGMPGLPEIIQTLFLRRFLLWNTNDSLGMIGANWKRKQIEKATEREGTLPKCPRCGSGQIGGHACHHNFQLESDRYAQRL